MRSSVFLQEDESMASDVVTIPEEQGLETHGIERVSPATRTHVRIFDNFTMWLSANLVISTIGLGALAIPIFQLGFWDSVAVIILFNALGVLPVAFFSTLGPKLGLRQMTISRFSFGWVGGMIMALFNVAIDSKLRGCDVVGLKVEDVAPHGYTMDRATIRQSKTSRPVRFEITEHTRQAIDDHLSATRSARAITYYKVGVAIATVADRP